MLRIGLFWALMIGVNSLWAQVRNDTVLIDFGSNISPFPWNNITDPVAGFIADMVNTDGGQSGIYILVYDAFNNINTAGTLTPDPAIGFPATATGDSFFGNTVTFGGQIQPTGGVELANLRVDKTYEITIFASRMSVTDNREARYRIEGAVIDSLFLNASNNTDQVASISIQPNAAGIIRITASPGPNNNNATGFYYLGAIRLVYEEEEPPVVAQMDTLLIDFGTVLSSSPWNNITDPVAGRVNNLINTIGRPSGRGIAVFDAFTGVNAQGTTSPSPALGFPGSATGDSFYGNTGFFAGQVQPTGGVELFSLDPAKPYDITLFASRMGTDIRQAKYVLQGLTADTLLLNASANTDMIARTVLRPAADSTIRITVSPGPNNNSPLGFFHLGAMRVLYEKETPPVVSLADTLLIDFGNNLSPLPWNNVTDPVAGRIDNLLTSAGNSSGRSIAVYDAFNNINTAGTLSPDPAIGFPPTATGDSFFGNTATFGGQVQPSGGVELAGLLPEKAHQITIFASRMASTDNREARYTLQGATTETIFLDAANNTSRTAQATIFPDSQGRIRIEVTPGPNNTNTSGFYYLGAARVVYERDPPPVDTLLVDFGNNLSPLPWNNVTDPVTGQIGELLTSAGLVSGKSLSVYDAFNNINTAGTLTPDPAIGFPATATGDSFFGNTVTFGGQVQPTGGVEFGNLDPAKPHTFIIFASRMASNDNREARYTLQGLSQETVLLDAANNTDRVANVTLYPAGNGTIRLEAAPGPNNNNASGFYYLGALKLLYERGAVSPPELTLVSPNGGEYWQAGKTPSIFWQSSNVGSLVLEYSTNNGTTWTTIDTVQAFRREYPWTVPNTPSVECLVRLRAPNLSVQSARTFEITADTTTCRIVVLGSSTAEGAGASPADSSWVNRYRKAIFQKDTRYTVTNLARGGYTTYHILPTGTPIPPSVSISIDPQRNITRALSLQPYAVIVNLPSNDAANFFPLTDQLANIALVSATANAANTDVWVSTSQPRNFGNPAQILLLTQFRDSILNIYGDRAIDFWTGIAAPNGFIQSAFDSGDGIHLNNAGHRLLFERVLAKGIDTLDCRNFNTFVPEVVQSGQLTVRAFPNPFQRHFTIEFEAVPGQAELQLLDVLGRKVAHLRTPVASSGLHQWLVELPEAMPVMLIGIVRLHTDKGWVQGSIRLMRG